MSTYNTAAPPLCPLERKMEVSLRGDVPSLDLIVSCIFVLYIIFEISKREFLSQASNSQDEEITQSFRVCLTVYSSADCLMNSALTASLRAFCKRCSMTGSTFASAAALSREL